MIGWEGGTQIPMGIKLRRPKNESFNNDGRAMFPGTTQVKYYTVPSEIGRRKPRPSLHDRDPSQVFPPAPEHLRGTSKPAILLLTGALRVTGGRGGEFRSRKHRGEEAIAGAASRRMQTG